MPSFYQLLTPLAVLGLTAMTSGCGAGEPETLKVMIEGTVSNQFTVKEGGSNNLINCAAGQPIELTLKNVSTVPKSAGGHNWVLLKKGVKVADFSKKVLPPAGKVENGFLPDAAKEDVYANTKMLGPDEEDTITFNAPSEPGLYYYLCTYSGHFGMMQGKLQVK